MNLVLNASEAIGERTGVICISTGRAQPDYPGLSGVLERPAGATFISRSPTPAAG